MWRYLRYRDCIVGAAKRLAVVFSFSLYLPRAFIRSSASEITYRNRGASGYVARNWERLRILPEQSRTIHFRGGGRISRCCKRERDPFAKGVKSGPLSPVRVHLLVWIIKRWPKPISSNELFKLISRVRRWTVGVGRRRYCYNTICERVSSGRCYRTNWH